MITHEAILTAASTEFLLTTIASVSYDDTDQLADVLAELHNDGRLDVLKVFRSDELPSADPTFFRLQQVFCVTLPRIRCSVAEAAATCQLLFGKGGNDFAAGRVYDALLEWLQISRSRADEGLTLVRHDLDNQTDITRLVLVAGADARPGEVCGRGTRPVSPTAAPHSAGCTRRARTNGAGRWWQHS